MKVVPIVCTICLKTKEIIYINENRYFCRELKDDSLRKKSRSLAQKLREIILKQKVAILSGTPVSIAYILDISHGSVSALFKHHLKLKKLSLRWVSHELTLAQQQHRVEN